MKCQICNKEVKDLRALSTHIQFKHENKSKEYYDSYMKKNEEGFCKICGEPTKYGGFSIGYHTYCSKTCMKSDYSEIKKESNPMKSESAKNNQRKTNQERYGVNSTIQLKSVHEIRDNNNEEKYGVKNVSQIKEVVDKANKSRSKTCMKEHGVPHYFMIEEVKEKIKKTFIEKYGFPYAIQNQEVFLRNQKSGCAAKPYKDLYYRGSFELDFLEKYYDKIEIKQGLSIPYYFKGKNRIYHSDFWVPSLNLIVEIKSSYLNKRHKKQINAKKSAVLAAGYNFVMIVDKDYSNFIFFQNS